MKENIGKIINTIDKIIENVVLGFSTAGFFSWLEQLSIKL